jgi:Septum formation
MSCPVCGSDAAGSAEPCIRCGAPVTVLEGDRVPVSSVRRVIPSARWTRFAVVTAALGLLTGFYGTWPAAYGLFHLDNVDTAIHFSDLQDAIACTAFGVFVAGPALTVYLTVRFAKRPGVMASTFGVTVFNWKTATVPWHDITGVTLTGAARFGRRGWVPGIVRKDGRVVPAAFAEFIRSGRRAREVSPQMPASGEGAAVSALVRAGLDAHDRHPQSGPAADRAVPATNPGEDPFALPASGGQPWTSARLAISREWVAFKDVTGKVPWNVIPYAAVSALRPAPGGGIRIEQPDGPGVVLDQRVLASPEASALLAEGLAGNVAVAPAARTLLRPYLEVARLERDSLLAARHTVDRGGTTHTIRLQRGLLLFFGIVVLAAAAAGFGVALAAPLSGWSPSVGSKGGEVELVGLGVLAIWFGIRLCRVGVQVTGQKLTIRNYVRTRTVNASDIRAITLQPKEISQGGAVWIPRVDLTDGTSIWITSFECGPARRPPKLDRVATVDEVQKLLGLKKADDPAEAPLGEDTPDGPPGWRTKPGHSPRRGALIMAGGGVALLAALIAVIAVRSSFTPSATQLAFSQLQPGDCLAGSNMGLDTGTPWPESVTRVACTKPHEAEVFFAGSIWPQSLAYPGQKVIDNQSNARCEAAFASYDGTDYQTSMFTMLYIVNDDSTDWASGDRSLECIAYKPSSSGPSGGTPLDYSIKGSDK